MTTTVCSGSLTQTNADSREEKELKEDTVPSPASSPTSPSSPTSKPPEVALTVEGVRRKLFTKEDKGNVHKTFGTMALLSFAYRYLYVWPTTGELGLRLDALGILTMAIHTLLACSGIIFRVPLKRIPRKPTMIWEEYRLHAVVFSLRCTLVYLLAVWSDKQMEPYVESASAPLGIAPTLLGQCRRILVVLAMHVAADVISMIWGESGKTTVRGDNEKTHKMALVRHISKFYAFYQFLALASHMMPHGPRAMDLGYNTLIAIQSSAFCMTLHRKGLIRWQTHATIYSVCLLFSGAYILHSFRSWTFVSVVVLAFAVRLSFGVTKYVIWPVFALGWVYGLDPTFCGCAIAAAAVSSVYQKVIVPRMKVQKKIE